MVIDRVRSLWLSLIPASDAIHAKLQEEL
jgi:hypothetical protein